MAKLLKDDDFHAACLQQRNSCIHSRIQVCTTDKIFQNESYHCSNTVEHRRIMAAPDLNEECKRLFDFNLYVLGDQMKLMKNVTE